MKTSVSLAPFGNLRAESIPSLEWRILYHRHNSPSGLQSPICYRAAILYLLTSFAVTGADFTFSNTRDDRTITGYTGAESVLAVPALIDGGPVTEIGFRAFHDQTNLTSVTLPDSVLSIDPSAFAGCSRLTNIIAPGVTLIQWEAFLSCIALCTTRFSPNLRAIGESAFADCSSLEDIKLDQAISIGNQAFRSCSALREVIIPNAIDLGYSVFAGCSSVTNLILGAQIRMIPYGTFAWCAGLANISLPNSLQSVGERAFFACANLTNVNIPNTTASIAQQGFAACGNLTAITVGSSNTFYSGVDGVLYNKSQSTLLQYPAGKSGPFTIPGSITNIAPGAFAGAAFLESLDVPDSVTEIGPEAFADAERLTTIHLGSGVNNIEYRAFSVPTLTAINVSAQNEFFSSKDGILFDKDARTLVKYPANKSGISYVVSNSVTNISQEAFASTIHLHDVKLGQHLTYIGEEAFQGSSLVGSITIPASVTFIGYGAFSFCTNLTDFYFLGDAPVIEAVWFPGGVLSDTGTVYYLPGTFGWEETFGTRPAELWDPHAPSTDPGYGIRNGHFSFNIAGSSNIRIVVETCSDLAQTAWTPISTNQLADDLLNLTDPAPPEKGGRFYRFRNP